MKPEDAHLVEAARAVCAEFPLRGDFSAGSVGAAVRTAEGNVYSGICIDLACGLGFCAEAAAVAEMLKHRETHIVAAVAVDRQGDPIAPCGRCREMIAQLDEKNLDCRILLRDGRVVTLSDLLPDHWLDEREESGSGF